MSRLIDISPYILCGTIFALALPLLLSLKALISSKSKANQVSTKSFEPPKGWWTDTKRFSAEQRAIFSQTWLCVSHRSRFTKAGDYIALDIAGFRVLFMLGKDGVVRAFHNICRHRAFPVAKKASGSATILGCKYHGWSYNTKGELTKAPHFEDVAGFDKSQNGLFPIHTKTDDNGFIHINLSSSSEAGETKPANAKIIGRLARINPNQQFLGSWEVKGKFNWKVTGNNVDGEIPLAHFTNLFSRFFGSPSAGKIRFSPLTTVYTQSGSPIWYQLTYSPESVRQTMVRCDVYSRTQTSTHAFDESVKSNLENQVQSLVQKYEDTYAKLISSGHEVPEDFDEQAMIAGMVNAHLKKEKSEGAEIKPAAVKSCHSDGYTKAEGICKALEGVESLGDLGCCD
ncbi:hypothetical protein FSARC_4011 [Fusarium sarcochroum]|uniref:Rieske domain-containing protein n=1 Tax=Fusarium sarcochroum TaxID=1208366 RepID=A0A8H4U2K5_9HYPO|nr:hypothetical protein FSARC_4011 [Fusarium sarcochroum]